MWFYKSLTDESEMLNLNDKASLFSMADFGPIST